MDEHLPMAVFGDFEIHTQAGALNLMKEDGIPRYAVVEETGLKELLAAEDVLADEYSQLYLKPHPMCFLYYMNSSFPNAQDGNVEKANVFLSKSATRLTSRDLLKEANNGLTFRLGRDVEEGEEILFYYPVAGDEEVAEDGEGGGGASVDSGGGPSVGSPRRSTRRRIAVGSSP